MHTIPKKDRVVSPQKEDYATTRKSRGRKGLRKEVFSWYNHHMIPISDSIKSHGFPITNLLLIAVTTLVFIQEVISPNPDSFIARYSLIPQLVNFSDFSTLSPFITAIFLHGGILHIVSNMLFLWVFGDNIEGYFGTLFFLFIYFATGIAGNLAQYALDPASSIPMLGASGAIAGILGSYFVLFPHSRIKTLVPFFGFVSVVEIPATIMLGYWFLLQVISGTFSLSGTAESGGIAFFAHIGGFAAGIILTTIMKPLVVSQRL